MDHQPPSAPDITVRHMRESDIDQGRVLMKQLGYELDRDEFHRRYAAVVADDRHALLVGERDGKLVALLHMYARPAIDKPPEAIVQALVVDSHQRGRGIGATMMRNAERWARKQGFSSVALTSHIDRADAHAFYAGLGYRMTATSHLFRREWEARRRLR